MTLFPHMKLALKRLAVGLDFEVVLLDIIWKSDFRCHLHVPHHKSKKHLPFQKKGQAEKRPSTNPHLWHGWNIWETPKNAWPMTNQTHFHFKLLVWMSNKRLGKPDFFLSFVFQICFSTHLTPDQLTCQILEFGMETLLTFSPFLSFPFMLFLSCPVASVSCSCSCIQNTAQIDWEMGCAKGAQKSDYMIKG